MNTSRLSGSVPYFISLLDALLHHISKPLIFRQSHKIGNKEGLAPKLLIIKSLDFTIPRAPKRFFESLEPFTCFAEHAFPAMRISLEFLLVHVLFQCTR